MEAAVRQRLRLRYRKDEVLMYVGHRDLLRFVIRLLRRTGIPFATSGHYSPKPRLTFGPALPLGVQAENELVDIELREDIRWMAEEVQAAAMALAKGALPRDFVASLAALPHVSPAVNKLIHAARYRLEYAELPSAVGEQLETGELILTRDDGRRQDLRPALLDYELNGQEITLHGAASSELNLNIMRLVRLLESRSGQLPGVIVRECLLDADGQPL